MGELRMMARAFTKKNKRALRKEAKETKDLIVLSDGDCNVSVTDEGKEAQVIVNIKEPNNTAITEVENKSMDPTKVKLSTLLQSLDEEEQETESVKEDKT